MVGGSRKAPRLGVCAIGGSGKTTACRGVAACAYVRGHVSQGSVWVQLSDRSTLQTVVDAGIAQVYRLCGADAARRLLQLKVHDDVVNQAARHALPLPAAESSQRLVKIDDVLYKKREQLELVLRLVPRATPALFTTRSESVVSLLGSQLVLVKGLPNEDARLLLSRCGENGGGGNGRVLFSRRSGVGRSCCPQDRGARVVALNRLCHCL